jgi:hypothetical protein
MAITTGAVSHADTVTRGSVPEKCNDHHAIFIKYGTSREEI